MSLHVYLSIDVDTGGPKPYTVGLYEASTTHNLNKMAEAAGIHTHLWQPHELGITTAEQLIGPLRCGLVALKADRHRFEAFNSDNGWGDYDGLVEFVKAYLAACKKHPKATVRVWR